MKFSIARKENVTFKYKWVQGQVQLCSDEVYFIYLFSEYMLTFRVEEPMKICVTN
jgi:hypothetical protein